eukprot:g967.t1
MASMASSGKKICVLGAGSYGTAIAVVSTFNGHSVTMYVRSEDQAKAINETHKNPKRFTDFELPAAITATTDFAAAVADAVVIVHAVPAQNTPAFIAKHAALFPAGVPVVSTSKGIHVASHQLMSEAIPGALGDRKADVPLAYLSGPSFAKEMIAAHPMSVVVASEDIKVAEAVQGVLSSTRFRIYISDDVIGVEVGGALKNPLAIGAGMAAGMGFGQSTIAGLVTRGCREMATMAVALGGKPETLSGLSGVGDLMLTCFSSLSRNNRCGRALAEGKTCDQICEEMGEVVEGVPTAKEVVRLAEKHNLYLPLFFACDKIIDGEIDAKDALRQLMSSQPGEETFVMAGVGEAKKA